MGLALIASAAWGTTVMVMSIGRNNAQILINGSLVRTLFLGEVSPEGIALRLIDGSAVVMEVEPASPAAKAGLSPGDVITRVNGKAVASAAQASSELNAVKSGGSARLLVIRNGQDTFVIVTKE